MRTNSCSAAVLGLAMLIGAAAAHGAPVANDEVAQAIKRMASENAQERANAAAGVRNLGAGAQAAIPALIQLLGDESPTRAAEENAMAPRGRIFPSPGFEAAQTLARMGGAALEPLTEAARSPDVATRERALWALLTWQDPRGAALIQAITDADPHVRALAAQGLAPGIGVNPLGALLDAVKDKNAGVRRAAVGSLGNVALSSRAADAIIALMKNDPESDVREAAAAALANSRDPRAHDLFVAALGAADQPVRNTAVQMLGILRDARAVGPLVGLLADKEPVMRMHAASSLAQIMDERAVAPLIQSIADIDPRVRNTAMDALGKITRQPLGVDEALWRKWWEENKARYPARLDSGNDGRNH
jgi:HEAT repeat protein